MKLFKHLINSIFGSKKKANTSTKEEHREIPPLDTLIKVTPEKEEPRKVEEEMATPNGPKEEWEEPTIEEVIPTKEYKVITEEDKASITDIIRPFVKDLNEDSAYTNFCLNIANIASKKLKTFVKLSEDSKAITVVFTQSPNFNKVISNFIKDHVVYGIINAINNAEYEVESDDEGIIYIHKI